MSAGFGWRELLATPAAFRRRKPDYLYRAPGNAENGLEIGQIPAA